MAQVQKRVASGTNNQPINTVSRKVPNGGGHGPPAAFDDEDDNEKRWCEL